MLALKDGSTVADNIFVYFALLDPNTDSPNHYGSLIRNIHIDLGSNPQVSGLSMNGAQFCSIEDVVITGVQFYAGIHGLPGSGGFSGNIRVEGGQIGIWQQQYRPVPSVTNVVLSGQNTTGILLQITRGPLVISGFAIISPAVPSPGYRAVTVHAEIGMFGMKDDGDGSLAFEDGSIQVSGANGVAIETWGTNIALKNVFVQAATLATLTVRNSKLPGTPIVSCGAPGWSRVHWVFTTSKSNVWVDDSELTDNRTFSYPAAAEACVAAGRPPANLPTSHAWNFSSLPSWEDENLCDVVEMYNATPNWVDDGDDDGAKIQRALDDATTVGHARFGCTVFIPHGMYRLGRTLETPAGTRLIGSGKFAELAVQNKYYANWEQGTPMIRSADTAAPASEDYGLVLADFSLHGFARGTYCNIHTAHTLWKAVILSHGDATAATAFNATGPFSVFSGHASGRVYGMTPGPVNFDQIPSEQWTSSFTLLMVNGTHGPLHFYQPSIEHQPCAFELMVTASANVHMHAFKFESVGIGAKPPAGSHPVVGGGLMSIRGSQNVTIFGGTGNFGLSSAEISSSILSVAGSDGVEIRALNRRPQPNEVEGSWLTNGAGVAIKADGALLFYSDVAAGW